MMLLCLANVWLAYGLWQQMGLLTEREASFAPGVRLVVALIWALIFLGLAAGAWRRVRPVRYLIPLSLLLFALYNAGALTLLGQLAYARQGVPLLLTAYATGTVLAGWVLNRPVARRYFDS
jgi:uncharacterized membrane protein